MSDDVSNQETPDSKWLRPHQIAVIANADRRRIRFQNAYNRSRSRETISPTASVSFQNYLNNSKNVKIKLKILYFTKRKSRDEEIKTVE